MVRGPAGPAAVSERPVRPVPDDGGVTVLLVDDHDIVRGGLRLLIERRLGYTVVEADSAEAALRAVNTDPPDVALIDVRMPGHDGLWALKELRERRPEIPVLILSTYDLEEYVQGALNGGACGYVLKESTSDQLAEAISVAMDGGGVYLHPKIAAAALATARKPQDEHLSGLTPREVEVLHVASDGLTNEEIADKLWLSEKTVKSHLTNIYRKLGVSNRTQAVRKALLDRIVEAG